MSRVDQCQVHVCIGQAFAARVEKVVSGNQGRQAGIRIKYVLCPGQHCITSLHFKSQMQKAVAAGREDLRTAAAPVESVDVPVLIPEERRVTTESTAESIEATDMYLQLFRWQLSCGGVCSCNGGCPPGIVIMVAWRNPKGNAGLADQLIPFDGLGYLDVLRFIRTDQQVKSQIGGHGKNPAIDMFRITLAEDVL